MEGDINSLPGVFEIFLVDDFRHFVNVPDEFPETLNVHFVVPFLF